MAVGGGERRDTVVLTAQVLQSGLLVALAVWAGVALSRPLGLAAPAFEAAVSGISVWSALKPQLVPAAIVGVSVGAVLVLLARIAPAELLALRQTLEIPIVAKLLYGGVAEEVLLRWGLMTVLIWLLWRFFQKRVGVPRNSYVVGGIVGAALLFGVLHLPAAAAFGASLTPSVITYIIVGNTLPGILFGFLYWRYGLEAAILAHALSHAVATLAAVAWAAV